MTRRKVCAIAASGSSYSDRHMLIQVVNFIISKFPSNFFKTVTVIDKLKESTIYAIETNNVLKKIEPGQIKLPHIIITSSRNGNNVKESSWEGPKIIDEYIAQNLQVGMYPYTNFYTDEYGLAMYMAMIYTKTELNFVIRVPSKNDQDTVSNTIDTYVKTMYGYKLDKRMVADPKTNLYNKDLANIGNWEPLSVDYQIDDIFINLYKELLFSQEIKTIRENIDSVEIKQQMNDNLNTKMNKQLEKGSNYGITVKQVINSKKKSKDIHYLKVYSSPYFMFDDNFSQEDPEKRGSSNEIFTLTASGYFEYHKPISWIINFPCDIKGEEMPDYMDIGYGDMSNISGSKHRLNFKKFVSEERNYVRYRTENEFTIGKLYESYFLPEDDVEGNNYVSIVDDIIEDDRLKMFIKKIIEIDKNKELLKNLKLFVYRDRYILDKDQYEVDENLIIKVKNINYDSKYFIDVFVSKNIINRFKELLRNEKYL